MNRPVALSPTQKPALAKVNRKDAPVRMIRSDEDVPLEIPEENIKTLLTLGFMSSLAFNINESSSDGKSLKVYHSEYLTSTSRKIAFLLNSLHPILHTCNI